MESKNFLNRVDKELKDGVNPYLHIIMITQRATFDYPTRFDPFKRVLKVGLLCLVNATKNCALEIDLDWELNAKPLRAITEEVSQFIEELIIKHIYEGHFDDVQNVTGLSCKAPREMKE
ncbi:hypothetical protein L1987_47411 [Smallanthus sonchifolius]|uniref:Uncharacterized protein n=1 Tax=Smallanthus sonchifolius TaxID=185202 RepID=A0ACB9G3J3_9ASTR|nr:hypothetical protein L1987_47411 [Smallanthus sonchifolius]